MLTNLIEGLDGLLALPDAVRYLLWLEVAQTVFLLGILVLLASPRRDTKDPKESDP